MNIRERVANGEFKNKVQHPYSPHVSAETNRENWANHKHEYRDGVRTATNAFRVALASEYQMTNNPKEEQLWNMAWDKGHPSGLEGVINYYEEFLALITRTVFLVESDFGRSAVTLGPIAILEDRKSAIAAIGDHSGIITEMVIGKVYQEGIETCLRQKIGAKNERL